MAASKKDLCDIANFAFPSTSFCADSYPEAAPVGSFKPNAFGLYDMHGNVAEWTHDCYQEFFNSARKDSAAQTICTSKDRVMGGGHFRSAPAQARSAARDTASPGTQADPIGVRSARDLN
jgi:formylglycine-generating enzyme required for sulfatase activity